MKELLSPKQVARAIDVSESSIKRWCDKGSIPTHYTAGGHRRIRLSSVIDFVKEGRYSLIRPEALGFPPSSGLSFRKIERSRDSFISSLLAGEENLSRQIILDLFLAGHSISRIFDEVVSSSFKEIGSLWACGDAEVYQERRGCEITLRILNDIKSIIQEPAEDSPIAIGGTPAFDQYTLGTNMVELVLRDSSWNSISLGSNLPMATLAAAIANHRPKLFWLSCSFIEDETQFISDFRTLRYQYRDIVKFVVGGYALNDEIVRQIEPDYYCLTMQDVAKLARELRPKPTSSEIQE